MSRIEARRRNPGCVLRVVATSLLVATGASSACTVSVGQLAFGAINPLVARATDSTATIQVQCPSATSYTIALGTGAGSYSGRQMDSGVAQLQYQLFVDASRLNVWGDGSGGSTTVAGTADASGATHVVYGSVPHQPLARSGMYSDSVLVTLSF